MNVSFRALSAWITVQNVRWKIARVSSQMNGNSLKSVFEKQRQMRLPRSGHAQKTNTLHFTCEKIESARCAAFFACKHRVWGFYKGKHTVFCSVLFCNWRTEEKRRNREKNRQKNLPSLVTLEARHSVSIIIFKTRPINNNQWILFDHENGNKLPLVLFFRFIFFNEKPKSFVDQKSFFMAIRAGMRFHIIAHIICTFYREFYWLFVLLVLLHKQRRVS